MALVVEHKTESVLRSAALLSDEHIQNKYRLTVTKAVEAARAALGPGVSITVRDLIPSDLGETNEIYSDQTGSSASTFETGIINSTIANERFVGIYGVYDASTMQAVSVLRVTVGGRVVAKWSLLPLMTDVFEPRYRTGIIETPVIIAQNIALKIESYVRVASSATELIFLGVTAEKAGKIIDV